MVDEKILVAIIATYIYESSKKKPVKVRVSRGIKVNSWKIASRMDILRWRF